MGAMVTLEKMAGNPGIYRVLKDGTDTGKRKLVYRQGGRQITETFNPPVALKKAQERRAETTTARAKGVERDPRAGRITLSQLRVEFYQQHGANYAPATLALQSELWKRIGASSLATRPLNKIDTAMVRAFLAKIDKPVMREKTRLLLSTMFNFAIEDKRIVSNPATLPRRSHTRRERQERNGGSRAVDRNRILNNADLMAIVDELPRRYHVLALLMARAGLRPGEALALRVRHYNPLTRKLTVETAVSGETKTGDVRDFPLPASVGEWIVNHLAEFSEPENPDALIFPTREGEMLTLSGFRTMFQRAARKAGLPGRKLTPNDLRHTAAAFAIEHDANVYHVQRMLGHSKPSITLDIYGALWDESMDRLAATLDAAITAEAAPMGQVVGLLRR